jgi:MSHA pilin protein MshC
MRLSSAQAEAIKQETERCFDAQAGVWLLGSRVDKSQGGFTLVELIMVMVIAGILAAVAAPRFFDTNVFQLRGFADEVQASLRYAQKVAIAQHRFVCAAFTSNSITMTIGATAACGTPLVSPTGEASYVINAPVGIAFTTVPTGFSFNALGTPTDASGIPVAIQTINITGINGITIEAETGYVHQ